MAPFTSPLAEELAPGLLERFLRYVRVDTQSKRDRERSPSTPGQLDLSRMLVAELKEIGLDDAALDDNGYVMATLPGTVDGDAPTIGLIAHVDTTPDESGSGVEPIVHHDYDGGVLEPPRNGAVLDPAVLEELGAKIGHGATLFDIERFGAACAYTLDGSTIGELQDETFSASEAIVTIRGVETHPGFATGKMVNASRLAGEVLAALPPNLTPEATSDRQGFIHVFEVEATVGKAVIRAIVRDFDDELLEH